MTDRLTPLQQRSLVAIGIVWLAFGLLISRLWYLQVIRGEYFRNLSENNRTRTIRTVAPRGYIYDRDGKVLVRNRPSFNIALMLEDTPNVSETLKRLAFISGRDISELEKNFTSDKKRRHFEPQVVLQDVSREELARIKANTYQLPGVIVEVVPTRILPNGILAAQLLGYVREISREQLEKMQDKQYLRGDKVGQAGLEQQYESILRGRSGFVRVEVDASGNRRGELGIVDDVPGSDLYLSLDTDLQRVAEASLGDNHGAVVAIDPLNGEVLALASSPSYDPNTFSGRMTSEEWKAVSENRANPLRNRAISDVYPPGSTFKLISASAALAEKVISETSGITCPGYFLLGRRWHCHKHSGHGTVSIRDAVMQSCNVFFYNVGQMLGVERLSEYSMLFGLGAVTGIDVPGEASGLVPTPSWKKEKIGERWYPGDTIPFSIGQGYLSATPLQMAVAASVIANGGTVYQPHLLRRSVNHETGDESVLALKEARKIDISENVWRKVRSFAVDVVSGERGTGKRAAIEGIVIGGKTGTAQAGAVGQGLEDHAWFISFAPADAPRIAMAILVEHGGHGGVTAAPISKAVMEVYFRKIGLLSPQIPLMPGVTILDGSALYGSVSDDVDSEGAMLDVSDSDIVDTPSAELEGGADVSE